MTNPKNTTTAARRARHTSRDEEELQPLSSTLPAVVSPLEFESLSSRQTTSHDKFWSVRPISYLMALLSAALFALSLIWSKLAAGQNVTGPDGDFVLHKPTFDPGSSAFSRYGDAFALALEEVSQNLQEDGTFMAGAGWTQLWTRDTSYAIELSLGLLYPRESQRTLETCTKEEKSLGITWLQDRCGHFGGWPFLSDAVVGIQGAWNLYLATGDREFLNRALEISDRTLKWAERDVYDEKTGLFKGCSSFMESNSGYPPEYRMNGTMVGETKALSTNVLYYNGYKYAFMMKEELRRLESQEQVRNETTEDRNQIHTYESKATSLGLAIRTRLWMEDEGYYAYFEDVNETLSRRMEGLGESLLLLAPELEVNQTRIGRIFNNTHRTERGLPCLWPRFERHVLSTDVASYYHNGRIWPFVQGYWALAAARHGRLEIFSEELRNLVELGLRNNTFAEFYELDGRYLHGRRRQLWSGAGYLGMIIHGLFGVELKPRGIHFRPVKSAEFQGGILKLENLVYRNIRLDIHVSGSGSVVETFQINGEAQESPFLEAGLKGYQLIEISLKD